MSPATIRIWLGAGLLALFTFQTALGAPAADFPFRDRQRVPPFPAGLQWFNTTGPMELHQLRGKFVLVDFWTYCCINCMHILPELKKLERAYPDSLVVIGVHSAKFETEQDSKNIAEAIQRYEIEHPVVNDAKHAIWDSFGVRAWPTLILIDPEGNAVWGNSGETTFEIVDKVLKAALPYYRKKGLLDARPLHFESLARQPYDTPLRFPGKVLADEAGQRLFIADSNHNRILMTRLDGSVVATIGAGTAGNSDGDLSAAEFDHPQGMALAGEMLFVADTENHQIRRVDLAERKVSTVAGTGKQARSAAVSRSAASTKIALSSPWDLWIHKGDLYIAMAGPHQIWRMKLEGSTIAPYAGNGREDIVDGPLLPKQAFRTGYASFAQPSGLASDGQWLYVADSEGSSIRAVPFDPRKEVRTVVGTSKLPNARLFTFGDVDGPADTARLQHPLGVAFSAGKLYVADTYNNKIKTVDPKTGEVATLAGTGKPGRRDDPAEFDEPAGISAAAGRLYVADTNNHLIRTVDPATGKVTTLALAGVAPPKPAGVLDPRKTFARALEETVPAASVRPENGSIRLAIELELPAEHKINTAAPMAYYLESAGEADKGGVVESAVVRKLTRVAKPASKLEIRLPLSASAGRERLRVWLAYYYCREGAEAICKTGSVVWTVPIEIRADGANASVRLAHRVP